MRTSLHGDQKGMASFGLVQFNLAGDRNRKTVKRREAVYTYCTVALDQMMTFAPEGKAGARLAPDGDIGKISKLVRFVWKDLRSPLLSVAERASVAWSQTAGSSGNTKDDKRHLQCRAAGRDDA